jgi:topoisomerase-4 subunit A
LVASIQKRKGNYLGSFAAEDKIFVTYTDGTYEIIEQELTKRIVAENVLLIEKFNPEKIVSAVYLDKEKLQYNIKRFKIETTTINSKFSFIKEGNGNVLEAVSTDVEPILVVQTGRGSQVRKVKFKVIKLVEVMGWKAVGAKLIDYSKSVVMEWEVKPKKDTEQQELF